MMRASRTLATLLLCLIPLCAQGGQTKPTPLSDREIETFAQAEQSSPAQAVTAGDYSAEQARRALTVQTATIAASLALLAAGMTGVGLAWSAKRRRQRALSTAKTERRARDRYPMAGREAEITLHTPFGEIKAAPVDISEGGMQIMVTEERPNGNAASSPLPDKIKISLSRAGEHGARILDTIPCMICWVCKDRLGLRFEQAIPLETLFAQRIAVPVPI